MAAQGPSRKALLGYDEGGFPGRGCTGWTALLLGRSIQQEPGFRNTIQRHMTEAGKRQGPSLPEVLPFEVF